LCEEPIRNVKFKILEAEIAEVYLSFIVRKIYIEVEVK
jgi:hypothetical protein